MRMIRKAFFAKPLSIYLAAALIAATAFAGPAEAMYLDLGPRAAPGEPVDRAADMAAIQRTLESEVVRQCLVDYGLSPEEALAKVSALTDDQVHQFATRLDSVQAGAGSIDATTLIIILLLVILILLLVDNTEGQQAHLA